MRKHVLTPLRAQLITRANRPSNMARISIPRELREGLESISLSIFTDMSNSGANFPTCLLAIYLSGLSHAKENLP